jgi:tetratricopeptide (TPR) repeat protein
LVSHTQLSPWRDNNQAWVLRAFNLLREQNATHPDYSKTASSLAQLYDRMNREEEACRLYETAAKLDATAAVRINVASCLAKQNKIDDAIALWSIVLKTNPAIESARLNLAVALFRTGRVADSKACLSEALRFNPASRRARELLASM